MLRYIIWVVSYGRKGANITRVGDRLLCLFYYFLSCRQVNRSTFRGKVELIFIAWHSVCTRVNRCSVRHNVSKFFNVALRKVGKQFVVRPAWDERHFAFGSMLSLSFPLSLSVQEVYSIHRVRCRPIVCRISLRRNRRRENKTKSWEIIPCPFETHGGIFSDKQIRGIQITDERFRKNVNSLSWRTFSRAPALRCLNYKICIYLPTVFNWIIIFRFCSSDLLLRGLWIN